MRNFFAAPRPRYSGPDPALIPVPDAVTEAVEAVEAEAAAVERAWQNGR